MSKRSRIPWFGVSPHLGMDYFPNWNRLSPKPLNFSDIPVSGFDFISGSLTLEG